MTMHLAHPALTTTGKKKGKKKWASAEHKRRAEEALIQQERLDREFNIIRGKRRKLVAVDSSPAPYRRASAEISSLEASWAPCLKKEPTKYTGTLIKGIATTHKSNLIPITSQEQAIEVARMRR